MAGGLVSRGGVTAFLLLFFLHHLGAGFVDGVEGVAGDLERPTFELGQLGQVVGKGLVAVGLELGLVVLVRLFAIGNALGQAVRMLLVEALGILRFFVLARFATLGFVHLRFTGFALFFLRNPCAASCDTHVVLIILLGHLDDVLVALERVDGRRDGLVHSGLLRLG